MKLFRAIDYRHAVDVQSQKICFLYFAQMGHSVDKQVIEGIEIPISGRISGPP